MYKIIYVSSVLIRQFVLPNPFSGLFSNAIYDDLFNITVGGTILGVISYILTGILYDKDRLPSFFGSLIFLFNYALLSAVLRFSFRLFSNSVLLAVLIFFTLFTIIFILERKLRFASSPF